MTEAIETKDVGLNIETSVQEQKIAGTIGLSAEQVAIIRNTVAKGTSNLELAYFLHVSKAVDLNPFVKEIWCYKDNKGNLIVFAGRDGFLKMAQRDPAFAGIRSCEVREKDEFSIDVANKKITHNVRGWGSSRGNILGAYAIVFRKEGEPTIEIADFARYNRKYNVWGSHPEAMIKKVAETNACKKAFGISGIQSEYEFDTSSGKAVPVSSLPVDLIGEIRAAREGIKSEITDENFLKEVCLVELSKSQAETTGEKNKIRKVLFESAEYDWTTGKKK